MGNFFSNNIKLFFWLIILKSINNNNNNDLILFSKNDPILFFLPNLIDLPPLDGLSDVTDVEISFDTLNL